jgi:hypothetical protein
MIAGLESKHCRRFGWLAGDCKRLHCTRCGHDAYRRIAHRIISATMRKTKIFFVTIYHNRKRQSLADLPLFDFSDGDEKDFRLLISKVLESLRKKMRRLGERLEYVAVLAFGRANHKIHKKVHCHILVTGLPDVKPKPSKAYPDRVECQFLDEKLKGVGLVAWVELPASKLAVARYTAKNLETVIGKEAMKNIRAYRFSKGFEE